MVKKNSTFFHRFSQLAGFLLGARIFVVLFFVFTLYVSTFFLFSQEESLRNFVFDYKVHGIILCAVLSISAGSIINQFYDLEKDRIQKPFRTRIQSFLKQKYFLYSYILLNSISLVAAYLLSPRIFVFFLIYQFMMWIYSHRLSKIVVLNNLFFVTLTLYPFFGMLVYYQHFSWLLFFMAGYLFIILLLIDILKDILTVKTDKAFNYNTLSTNFGIKTSTIISVILLILNAILSVIIIDKISERNYLSLYYLLSAVVHLLCIYPLVKFRTKNIVWLRNFLRFWVFVGVVFMLLNGIYEKF